MRGRVKVKRPIPPSRLLPGLYFLVRVRAHPRLRLSPCAGATAPSGQTPRGNEGAGFHAALGMLWAGLCPSHRGEGEEPMPPGSSQHPLSPSPAQHVHAAGAGSSAATRSLFKRSLLTPLIPSFSLARLPASLPGGGPEPANCTSKLQCVSPLPGVLFSSRFRNCWPLAGSAGQGGEWQHPFPFGISSQIILVLD